MNSISQLVKIFLKIICGRFCKKCEESIRDAQLGRGILFCLDLFRERCHDINVDRFPCCIDAEKLKVEIQHDKLMELLINKNKNSIDTHIIGNLYW